VGLTIGLGQRLRCLHPPAVAVALLGVLLNARAGIVLSPILSGSVLLVLIAALFHRLQPAGAPYPHPWL
jgi:CBS-domain-containing membrane protein